MVAHSKRALCLMAALLTCGMGCALASAADPAPLVFDFSKTAPAGAKHVAPADVYSKKLTYGFEPGAAVTATDTGVTSAKPFYFSTDLGPGNYKVTVTLGNPTVESTTTVKAELRRLMLEQIHADAGKPVTKTFVVNVRTPAIAGSTAVVGLKKPRETTNEAWAWDDRLTLEFNGTQPSVSSIQIEPVEVPTVFILGDSTVCDQSGEPFCSWGQMITRWFKTDVAVSNQAESGESVASSIGARRFAKVLGDLKAGDYVLIQYGHNDMKEKAPNASQKFTDDLIKYVGDVKAKKGTVILITPMNRHTFNGDNVTNSLAEYTAAMEAAAKGSGAPLIDLNAMSATMYESFGATGSLRIFEHNADMSKNDATHHSPYGAYELSKCVITGLRKLDLPLVKSISDDMPVFDPAKPDAEKDFHVPASPNHTNQTPLGS